MPKVRGKKNGSNVVIASFNSEIRQKLKNLKAFKALLLVSIEGNECCSDDYLQAQIATGISQHQTFTVLIADEIYWHNLRPEAHCYLETLLVEIKGQPEQATELLSSFIPKYFDSLVALLHLGMEYKNNFLEMNYEEQLEALCDINNLIEQKLRLEAKALGERFFEKNLPYILSALKLDMSQLSPDFSALSMDDKIQYLNSLASNREIPSLNKNESELACNFSIVRWEQWQSQSSFIENKLAIENIMQTTPSIKQSIQVAAAKFAERHSNKDKLPKNIWQMRSQFYLRDEAPVIMWLTALNGYDFIAYPGEILTPFEKVQEVFIGSQNIYGIPESLFIKRDDAAPYWLDIFFKWVSPAVDSNSANVSKSSLATHGLFAQSMETNQYNVPELSPEDVTKKINKLLENCPSQVKLEIIELLNKSVKESSLKSSTAGSGFP